MVRSSAKQSPAEGFTLLELLVAMALLSLLMVMMVTAMRGVGRALIVAEHKSRDASVGAARLILRRIVAETRPIKSGVDDSLERTLLDGQTNRLRLITTFAVGGSYNGLLETAITMQPDAAGAFSDLIIEQRLFRQPEAFASFTPRILRIALQKKIAALEFRYFGRLAADGTPEWYSSWRHQNVLPQLIEIAVVFPHGDTRVWTPLVIEVNLAGL